MLLPFPNSHPAGRNSCIVAGAGTRILEQRVVLEAKAMQAEQQDRRKLDSKPCDVHTGPGQPTLELK